MQSKAAEESRNGYPSKAGSRILSVWSANSPLESADADYDDWGFAARVTRETRDMQCPGSQLGLLPLSLVVLFMFYLLNEVSEATLDGGLYYRG